MTSDFLPTAGWEYLRLRAELLCRLRKFFFDRGFLEVETPILSADTVVDRHLDPFSLEISLPGQSAKRFWLQTSPELAMKRLLAAGAKAIYQVSRVFRQDEIGPLHNPEFTLVEWYKVGHEMNEGMQLTGEFAEIMLQRGPVRGLTYREAFLRYADIDPLLCKTEDLVEAVKRLGISAPESLSKTDRDGWLDLLLTERVQPHLGLESPELLYDFPASQAALSRVRNDNPPVAERFELYCSGIELANGYHELLDADELLQRNREANRLRIADGKTALPEQSRMLAAMRSGLAPAVGVAVGFDRLVMLAAGVKTVRDVIAFPIDRA